MKQTPLTRRTVVKGLAAASISAAMPPFVSAESIEWPDSILTALNTQTLLPCEGVLKLSVPAQVQTGNFVPVTLKVTLADITGPTELALYAAHNSQPAPLIMACTLPNAPMEHTITTRVRIGSSQPLYAVLKAADGRTFGTSSHVDLLLAGYTDG